jgi:putative methyltransferase (TIGR04325 family)
MYTVEVREILKSLVPPALGKIINAFRFRSIQRYKYLTDYSNDLLTETVIWKNVEFKKSLSNLDLPSNSAGIVMAVSLAASGLKELRVLDFGGGGGNLHSIAEKVFPQTIFDWTVVETPAMVKAASQEKNHLKVTFISEIPKNINKMSCYDLIIASSSLQYTENPLKTLNKLLSLKPRFIYVSRTPLNCGETSITYNQKSLLSANGPISRLPKGTKEMRINYKNTVVPRKHFTNALRKGFNIKFAFNEGIWDSSFGKSIATMTYFAELRKDNHSGSNRNK